MGTIKGGANTAWPLTPPFPTKGEGGTRFIFNEWPDETVYEGERE